MEWIIKCDSVEISFGGTPVVHGVSFSLAPGKILGIEVVDHILIGDGSYVSFREERLLP